MQRRVVGAVDLLLDGHALFADEHRPAQRGAADFIRVARAERIGMRSRVIDADDAARPRPAPRGPNESAAGEAKRRGAAHGFRRLPEQHRRSRAGSMRQGRTARLSSPPPRRQRLRANVVAGEQPP